jgi:hypothetical protein
MLKFTSWSSTRLSDYNRCPKYASLKHLAKLCPKCFEGKVKGGYDTPAVCGTCKHAVVKGPALVRGIEIGGNLEKYVNGEVPRIHKEIEHKGVKALAKKLRDDKKKGADVQTELTINFDRNWRRLGPNWCPELWLVTKLDVFWSSLGGTSAHVIDWKTGGVGKDGKIKPGKDEEYKKQLRLYNASVLAGMPEVHEVSSELAFVDVKDGNPYSVTGPTLTRNELEAEKKWWEKESFPMFADRTFPPTANGLCGYCEFSKSKGGPCKF